MKRIYLVTFLIFGVILNMVSAKPAAASHQFLWWDEYGDRTFASFGANSYITINTGQMEYVNLCGQGGTNDFLYPATDAYIVPSGSVSEGSELEDVSGEPSTIIAQSSQGMFLYEQIGITAPSGSIGEGRYAVVYDECQDGRVDPGDFVLDPAFEVRAIPTDVPPLPSIAAEKALAGIAAQELEDLHEWLDDWFKAQTALDPNPLNRMLYGMGTTPITAHPAHIVLIQVANQAKHYKGIEADPPDPAFQQNSPLLPRETIDLRSNDPLLLAMAGVGAESSSEGALAEALLRSLERYQGADQKGNGTWALVHARAIRDYSLQLRVQLAESSDALQSLDTALAADTTPLDANAADIQSFITRVHASGFTEEEVRAALNLGLTYEEIGQLDSAVSALDLSTFSKANLRGAIADLRTNNDALAAELAVLATDMQTGIATLEADPLVSDKAPKASAGGPYGGSEGAAVSFDGSGSTSPSAITTYEWDLDGDGAFDDATGATPTRTYQEAFEGLVGVRVTNADNLRSVAYARLEVADVNRRPAIDAASPADGTVTMDAGASRSFEVAASDPDGDAVSVAWFVDGVSASTGASLAYSPTSADVGLHTVEARVGDDSSLGGEVRRTWSVAVLVPDADGDGYRANADCDDTDAGVNPGATEVLGNGRDDDCDPGTPDTGVPPTARFTVDPATAIVGEPVRFTDGSTDPDSEIVAWSWAFGDGGAGTEQNPSHTYTAPGAYTVTLTATDEHGNTHAASKTVRATSAPIAAFTHAPAKAVVDAPVRFTDASSDPDGAIASWVWDLGDGATATGQNPSHTYTTAGRYTVTLTVTDTDGATSSATRELAVIAPPVAFFNPEPALDAGIAGRNVALLEGGASIHSYSSQYSTGYPAQTLINYATTDSYWATGRGQLTDQWVKILLAGGETYLVDRVRLMPATHSTERVSEFEIAVSTTTADDSAFTTALTATAANNGTLQEFVLPRPVLAKYVLYRPLKNRGNTCCLATQQLKVLTGQEGGQTVVFENRTADADGDIVSWLWDFGDGTTSTEKSPTHIFPESPGTYTVMLTATDAEGQTDTYTLEQRVLTPPAASFTFTPAAPNEAQSVSFTDASSDPDGGTILTTRAWTWGDGESQTTTANALNHTFTDDNSYTVTLRVVDSQEQTSEVQRTVTTANVPPTASAGADQTLVWGRNLAMTATVNDASSVDRASLVCDWDFGDGRTVQVSRCNNSNARVAHAYADPGTYTATLTVTDKDGGSKSDSFVATVRKRDTFAQALSTRNVAGGQVEVSARLYDRYSWSVMPNRSLTFSAGSATATATTGADGIATATLPRAVGVDTVGVSFAADTHFNESRMERPIEAPFGDIVFMIDESGSMGEDQNDVRRRITDIALQLGSRVDFQLGLVGYGASEKGGGAHIQSTLTKDIGAYTRELDKLETSGGFEPGFNATVVGMSDAMSFRQNAGTCAILITDEDADISAQIPTTKADALAALQRRNAIFLGIVGTGGTTADDYGPNPGSLADATGGQVFRITDFRRDPAPVLTAIIDKCIKRIATPDLELTKTDGQETARVGDELTYTLTVANTSTGNATGISLEDTLPTGTSVVTASDGGTVTNGVVTWPAFDLAAGQTATRTVTLKVDGALATGDRIVNTATVADDGTNGPDPTPGNNTASDTDTVEAPANTAPNAHDQSVGTDEDEAARVTFAATDAEGDALTYTIATQPAHGTLSGAAPDLTYTPDANYSGSDAFTFTANDGTLDSNIATVSITVRPVNDAPHAGDDVAATDEDSTVLVDVLANDSDPEGDALSVTALGEPSHGSAELVATGDDAGKVRYTPRANYNGPDSFTYTIGDGNGGSDTATVSVTVRPVNDGPIADDDAAETPEDEALTLARSDLLGNDSDPDTAASELSVSAVSGAAHGRVELLDSGAVRFVPDADYTGRAGFSYTVSDGELTDTARVAITVTPVNDPPVAADDAARTDEDTELLLTRSDLVSNDSDVDGDTLAIDAVGEASHGTVRVVDGTVRYAPEPDYHGPDSFTYTVSDGNGGTDTATVEITVSPVNDAPEVTAGPDVLTDEGTAVEVTATFTDVEDDQRHTCTVIWGDGSESEAAVTEPAGAEPGTCVASHTYADDDPTGTPRDVYAVTVRVTDDGAPAESGTAGLAATIRNLAPVISDVAGPADPLNIDSATATVTISFTDEGSRDTHGCAFDWGDRSDDGSADGSSGACSASHTWTAPGVYPVMVQVIDDDTGRAESRYEYVVVYDPDGGFVTGGGWIESPAGAYTPDPSLAGRANIGFVSKYKPGATVPTGSTEFQFQTAKLNFHSSGYEWLVVSGARAQYKGSGTINGAGGYGFLLTAIDGQISGGGGTDKLRIRIWDKESGAVVYDNQMDDDDTATPTTSVRGGSIVIHKSR